MPELRLGEVIVNVAGGKCAVCKEKIKEGKAIQLSSFSAAIRHFDCVPKKDKRGIHDAMRRRHSKRMAQNPNKHK